MWRPRGTSGGHLPVRPPSPARQRPPAVDGRKVGEEFSRARTTSHSPRPSADTCGTATSLATACRARWTPQTARPGAWHARLPGAARGDHAAGRPSAHGTAAVHRPQTPRGAPDRSPTPLAGYCSGRAARDQLATTSIGQLRRDLGVHPHGDGVLARGLDAAGQLDAATVELRATGRGDGGGDVGGGDAPEQAATGTGAGRHADGQAGQAAGHGLAPRRACAPHGRRAPGAATRSASRHRGWPGWPGRGAGGSCGRTRP